MSKDKLKTNAKTSHFEFSNNKGITLVALIITIIIMLILVAVTFNIALSENGIIYKTKRAVEETEREGDKEILLSLIIGSFEEKINGINGNQIKSSIEQKGWSYNEIPNTSIIEVYDEKDKFIAYINIVTGEIKDEIDDGNDEDGVTEVNLDGTYMGETNFEIVNNNTLILGGTSYPLTIDENNKTATVTIDGKTTVFNYELITSNNEVINIVFLTGNSIFYQSNEGLQFELDGIYEFGNFRLKFNAAKGTVDRAFVYAGEENIGEGERDMLYCGYKGNYYIKGSKVTVSSDLSQVTFERQTYEKSE